MNVELIPHPRHPPRAVTGVQVVVGRPAPNALELSYWVFGEMDDLRLSAPAAPLRTDNLWRTTCFEAFLAFAGAAGYREFNFSPSTQWAAYRLKLYRDPNRKDARLPAPPAVSILLQRADRMQLKVDLSLDLGSGAHRLGLSAVIEERDGTCSYWALAHPPGAPDFHHPDCFALELPAARPA